MSAVESQVGMTDLIPCSDQCGGSYDTYSFTQTEKEVNILVPLTPGTTSKQLTVELTPTHLKIGLKGKSPILDGTVYKPIKASESTWTIEDKKLLTVTLIKTNLKYEEWWPCVVEGERQIDMKTLKPPAVNMMDLDEGAQAKIARMMFDQDQKRKGLPTSDALLYP
ncbi:nuclear movement protein [Strigomonas culicis]|uniref:Nuclear movement protein n=1 Tax=Strigomonas culicis TaxID=28005 RepID=S9V909_9TRYP|eukprot:EPY24780.1 nuclear movement protein [Strigomonas culicis]